MAIVDVIYGTQKVFHDYPKESLIYTLLAVPLLYIIINEYLRLTARVSGLRGPSGLPLIGNLHQIRKNAAEKYRQWSQTYGAVYQIQLGNIPVVVVNTAATARALFGQNAQALSSRPKFYTFHKVSWMVIDQQISLSAIWIYLRPS